MLCEGTEGVESTQYKQPRQDAQRERAQHKANIMRIEAVEAMVKSGWTRPNTRLSIERQDKLKALKLTSHGILVQLDSVPGLSLIR